MLFYSAKYKGFYHSCEEWYPEEAWCEFVLRDNWYHCETCNFKFPSILAMGSIENLIHEGMKRYLIGIPAHTYTNDPELVKLHDIYQ